MDRGHFAQPSCCNFCSKSGQGITFDMELRYSVVIAPACHPLINPRVNPADILPVNGIPKLVIAIEAAAA
jgi:hypothetical protein